MIRPLQQKQMKLRSHRNSIMKEIKIAQKLANYQQLQSNTKISVKQVPCNSSNTSKKNSFCDSMNFAVENKNIIPRQSRMKVKLDEIIKLSSKFKTRAKVQHSASRFLGKQAKQLIKSIFQQQIKTLPSQQEKQNNNKSAQKQQFFIEENCFSFQRNQQKRRVSAKKRQTVPSIIPLSEKRQSNKSSWFYWQKPRKAQKISQKIEQMLLEKRKNQNQSRFKQTSKTPSHKLKQFLQKSEKNLNKFWRKNMNQIEKTSIFSEDCQKLQKFIRGQSNFDNDASQYSDYVSLSEMNKTKQKFTTFAQIYKDVQTSKKMSELSFEMLKDNKLASVVYLNENLCSVSDQKQRYYLEKLKIVK